MLPGCSAGGVCASLCVGCVTAACRVYTYIPFAFCLTTSCRDCGCCCRAVSGRNRTSFSSSGRWAPTLCRGRSSPSSKKRPRRPTSRSLPGRWTPVLTWLLWPCEAAAPTRRARCLPLPATGALSWCPILADCLVVCVGGGGLYRPQAGRRDDW